MSLKNQNERRWVVFEKFLGYQTRYDASSDVCRGRLTHGQNVQVTDGKITVRSGSSRVGFLDYSGDAPARVFNFKKSNSKEILMRARGTVIEWFHPDLDKNGALATDDWDTLVTGLTAYDNVTGENIMRFAVNVQNTEVNLTNQTLYVFFCNAAETLYRWTGAYGRFASATATTIVVQGTTTLADLGFTSTGSVIMNGTTYQYDSISSQTFTLSAAQPNPTSGGQSAGEPLAQIPLTVSAAPRGNILISRDSRLLISNIKKDSSGSVTPREEVIGGSQIGDATNWTISSPRTDGQAFYYALSSGGPCTGLAQDEQAIYVFGATLINQMTFESTTAVTAMNDMVRVKPLKAHDGRSYTVGSIFPDAVTASPNGILFVTQDKKCGFLTSSETTDYPQILSISDLIQPTFDTAVFDRAAGIVYKDKYFLALKKND